MAKDDARAAREDLAETLAELDDRLRPQELAADANASLRRAVSDAGDVVTGKGLPDSGPRKRRALGLLAVGGGVVLVVAGKLLRRR